MWLDKIKAGIFKTFPYKNCEAVSLVRLATVQDSELYTCTLLTLTRSGDSQIGVSSVHLYSTLL